MPDKSRYSRVRAEEIPELIDKHFQQESQAEPMQLVVAGCESFAVK